MGRRVLLGLASAAVLVLGACSSSSKSSSSTTVAAATLPATVSTTAAGAATTGGATTGGATTGDTITVADFAFSPPVLTVKVGTAVDIKNTQAVNHTFTADDGSFNIELDPNGGGSQTFATAGTFSYHCEIHSSMKGTVVVQG